MALRFCWPLIARHRTLRHVVTNAEKALGFSHRLRDRQGTAFHPQVEQIAADAGVKILPYATLCAGNAHGQAAAGFASGAAGLPLLPGPLALRQEMFDDLRGARPSLGRVPSRSYPALRPRLDVDTR